VLLKLLTDLIASYDPANPHFRPTELYNESWLVKLVLDQASKMSDADFPLGFLPRSTWFSEALLPSAFEARFRGDPLSESRTNADVVVGHIAVGAKAKADLELANDVAQFSVIEAKVGSPLSSGTTNAKYFDQAARNVACMAEVLAREDVAPASLEKLDFTVIAPAHSIEKGTFAEEMTPTSIRAKVERRVSEYDGALDKWFEERFEPLLALIQLHSLSWEEAIDWLGEQSPNIKSELTDFYDRCLEFA
jgi:hypothetical protein